MSGRVEIQLPNDLYEEIMRFCSENNMSLDEFLWLTFKWYMRRLKEEGKIKEG